MFGQFIWSGSVLVLRKSIDRSCCSIMFQRFNLFGIIRIRKTPLPLPTPLDSLPNHLAFSLMPGSRSQDVTGRHQWRFTCPPFPSLLPTRKSGGKNMGLPVRFAMGVIKIAGFQPAIATPYWQMRRRLHVFHLNEKRERDTGSRFNFSSLDVVMFQYRRERRQMSAE